MSSKKQQQPSQSHPNTCSNSTTSEKQQQLIQNHSIKEQEQQPDQYHLPAAKVRHLKNNNSQFRTNQPQRQNHSTTATTTARSNFTDTATARKSSPGQKHTTRASQHLKCNNKELRTTPRRRNSRTPKIQEKHGDQILISLEI
jgi:hypothetical protein